MTKQEIIELLEKTVKEINDAQEKNYVVDTPSLFYQNGLIYAYIKVIALLKEKK